MNWHVETNVLDRVHLEANWAYQLQRYTTYAQSMSLVHVLQSVPPSFVSNRTCQQHRSLLRFQHSAVSVVLLEQHKGVAVGYQGLLVGPVRRESMLHGCLCVPLPECTNNSASSSCSHVATRNFRGLVCKLQSDKDLLIGQTNLTGCGLAANSQATLS